MSDVRVHAVPSVGELESAQIAEHNADNDVDLLLEILRSYSPNGLTIFEVIDSPEGQERGWSQRDHINPRLRTLRRNHLVYKKVGETRPTGRGGRADVWAAYVGAPGEPAPATATATEMSKGTILFYCELAMGELRRLDPENELLDCWDTDRNPSPTTTSRDALESITLGDSQSTQGAVIL